MPDDTVLMAHPDPSVGVSHDFERDGDAYLVPRKMIESMKSHGFHFVTDLERAARGEKVPPPRPPATTADQITGAAGGFDPLRPGEPARKLSEEEVAANEAAALRRREML